MKKRIAVLISSAGTGTNLQAIIDAVESKKLNAEIVVVVSDAINAYGLTRAKKHKLQTLIFKNNNDLERLLKNKYKTDFIALAGWKKTITFQMIKNFHNRILNIHPGLIPDKLTGRIKNPDGTDALWNRGKFTDAAIKNFLDSKSTYAGSSVHLLTDKFDFGHVLARCFEKISGKDDVESLYQRLKKKENKIYVTALKKLCNQR